MPFLDTFRKMLLRGSRQPRSYPRLMISEPVRLRTTWSAEQPAILEDISAGGACIRTHVRLRPGDTVAVLMSLGIGYRFDTRARVVYSNRTNGGYQSRYGLRFVGLGAQDVASISDFVVEQKFGRQFGVRAFKAERETANDSTREAERD
ncbi:MAG: PilZ domain-containing protein [Candidatus Eremiobacteraeota bacterium]|nr:PilZ domain-containing protein [Candidatus Eremiobacteraeota bacterium]